MSAEHLNPAQLIESDPATARKMFLDFYSNELGGRKRELVERGVTHSSLLVVDHYIYEAESRALSLGVDIPTSDKQVAWAKDFKDEDFTEDAAKADAYIMRQATLTARTILSKIKATVGPDNEQFVDLFESTARKRASFESALDETDELQTLYDKHVRTG